MLHMRFTSRERANTFRQHPVVQDAFRTEVQPVAGEVVEVLFQVRDSVQASCMQVADGAYMSPIRMGTYNPLLTIRSGWVRRPHSVLSSSRGIAAKSSIHRIDLRCRPT